MDQSLKKAIEDQNLDIDISNDISEISLDVSNDIFKDEDGDSVRLGEVKTILAQEDKTGIKTPEDDLSIDVGHK